MSKMRLLLTTVILITACTQSALSQTWEELLDQADSLSEAREYLAAHELRQWALVDAEAHLGPNDTAIASILQLLSRFDQVLHRYNTAESALQGAVKIWEQALGPNDRHVANCLGSLGRLYMIQEKYTEAMSAFERVLSISTKSLGPINRDVARTLFVLAEVHREMGALDSSRQLYEQSAKIYEISDDWGWGYGFLEWHFFCLSIACGVRGDTARARVFYEWSTDIAEEAVGRDNTDFAWATDSGMAVHMSQNDSNVIFVLSRIWDLESFYIDHDYSLELTVLLERKLAILVKAYGPDHPDVAQELGMLAYFYMYDLEDNDKVGSLLEAVLAQRRALFGDEHQAVIEHQEIMADIRKSRLEQEGKTPEIMLWEATWLCSQGEFVRADTLFEQLPEAFADYYGPSDTLAADVAGAIGEYYRLRGDPKGTERMLRKASSIRGMSDRVNRSHVATILLAEVFAENEMPAEATLLSERAVAIMNEEPDLNIDIVVKALERIASQVWKAGRYVELERLQELILKVRETSLGSHHPELTGNLLALAKARQRLGKHSEAQGPIEQALEIRRRSPDVDHAELGRIMNQLGSVYSGLGRHRDATQTLEQALVLLEKGHGVHPNEIASSLIVLALEYGCRGRYDQAVTILEQALSIFETWSGRDSPDVASTCVLIAFSMTIRGNREYSRVLADRSLAICQKTPASDHPVLTDIMPLLSTLYRALGDSRIAMELSEMASQRSLARLMEAVVVMSHDQALSHLKNVDNAVGSLMSSYIDSALSGFDTFNDVPGVALSTKGLILNLLVDRHRLAAGGLDSTVTCLADSLRQAIQERARLFMHASGGDMAGYRLRLDSVVSRVDSLERELALHCASFQEYSLELVVSPTKVASELPVGAAAIELFETEYFQLDPRAVVPWYMAVILTPSADPEVVDLGPAAEIDSLVEGGIVKSCGLVI